MTHRLMEDIKESLSRLSPSMEILAAYILSSEPSLENCTIQELANQSGVSTTTITRFFQLLGYESYSEFRVDLSVAVKLSAKDQDETVLAYQIFNQHERAIERLRIDNSAESLERFCDYLMHANVISIVSTQSNEVVGEYFRQKLCQIEKRAVAYSVVEGARLSKASWNHKDVIVLMSDCSNGDLLSKFVSEIKQTDVILLGISGDRFDQSAQYADMCLFSNDMGIGSKDQNIRSRISAIALVESLVRLCSHKVTSHRDLQQIKTELCE